MNQIRDSYDVNSYDRIHYYTGNEMRHVYFTLTSRREMLGKKVQIIVLKGTASSTPEAIFSILYLINGEIKYVNLGPSLISMDGEYRRDYYKYESLLDSISASPEVLSFIRRKLESQLTINLYGGKISVDLAINIYCVQYILFMYRDENGITPSHTNIAYIKALPINKNGIWRDIKSKYTILEYRPIISQLFSNNQFSVLLKIGQKIQPLSSRDIEYYGDLTRPIWRELALNKIATDIVFNNISGSFSILTDWYMIPMIPQLFDNPAMKTLIEHSDKVEETLSSIINTADGYVNYTIMNALRDPINIIRQKMKLSGKALLTISEYVGYTWANIMKAYNLGTFDVRNGRFLHNGDLWAKYLFELLYALYCMNSIMNVIHGDLHLNNITFHQAILTYSMRQKKFHEEFEDAMDYYDLTVDDTQIKAPNAAEYLFSTLGAHTAIIDFSRSIFRSDIIDDRQLLKDVIMWQYESHFPSFFKKHATNIEVACIRHPVPMWYLFTAFDVYNVLSKLELYCKELDLKPSNECKVWTSTVKAAARTYLIDEMEKFITDKSTPAEVMKKQLPNRAIIASVFGEFEAKKYLRSRKVPKKAPIISFYKYLGCRDHGNSPCDEGQLPYSIFDCEKLPAYIHEKVNIDGKSKPLSKKEVCQNITAQNVAEEEIAEQMRIEPTSDIVNLKVIKLVSS